jgi:hypothetical protein
MGWFGHHSQLNANQISDEARFHNKESCYRCDESMRHVIALVREKDITWQTLKYLRYMSVYDRVNRTVGKVDTNRK